MEHLDGALAASTRMMRLLLGEDPLPDDQAARTVADFDAHFTPGLIRYRKSVTESGDFAALEWTGEGSIVRDQTGREWIDCLGGYGIYSHGIRNPEITAAVKAQLDRNPMPTQELLDPFKGMACRLLAQIGPGGQMSNAFITNSGTESVEAAMKIARVATGRSGFICAEGAFHGKTLGALSLMGKPAFREAVEPLLGPVYRAPFGDAAAVEALLAEHGAEVAACIFEPIQGEAGAVVPPDDFWPRVRSACDQAGVLLIADEVQTCLGRTGAMWGVDHWEVAPDLVTAAKALGGGVMPVGAVIGPYAVWKHLEANPFLHTSTFGGNPLACAAAIAAIHLTVRDRLWEAASAQGARFIAGIETLAARHPMVLRGVRGRGLLLGLMFPDDQTGFAVAAELFRRGVLVAGTQISATTVRIEPALTISDGEVDEILSRLDAALAAVAG